MTPQIILDNARARISKIFFPTGTAGVFVAIITLLFIGKLPAANILINSGFEVGSLTNWTAFGGNNYSISDASIAHDGVNYYKVYGQFSGATNYTGIYQDNPSAPGAIYSADGWAYSLSN